MEYLDVLQRELEAQQKRESYVSLTLVKAEGPTSRRSGKMLVMENGERFGTIGGGVIEKQAVQDAQRCLKDREPALLRYDINALDPNEIVENAGKMTVYLQPFSPRPLLLMCGAGHCGCAVMKLANDCGFEIWLADSRDPALIEEPIKLSHRFFPVENFAAALKDLLVPAGACIVIATSSHATDGDALVSALSMQAQYVGMIGSEAKVKTLFAKAREQGVDEARLRQVCAPIGLDIGGETPQHIAVSIMAQIMAVLHQRDGGFLCRSIRAEEEPSSLSKE